MGPSNLNTHGVHVCSKEFMFVANSRINVGLRRSGAKMSQRCGAAIA